MTNRYSMTTPEFAADPYPVLNRLREEAPVHWHADMEAWTIARYDDVSAGVRNHQVFSNAGGSSAAVQTYALSTAQRRSSAFGAEVAKRRLSSRDQPSHRPMRQLMGKIFLPRAMGNLQPKIEAIADELVGEMRGKIRDGRPVDLVADFVYPMTILSINLILGVPDSVRDVYRSYTTAVDESMGEYFRDIVRHKEKCPGDDMTTDLVNAARAGHDHLAPEEVPYMLGGLWTAANWTTTLHISNTVALMQSLPAARAELARAPDLVPAFVEESLRYDPPVLFTMKKTLSEITMQGQTIPEGAAVAFLYAAANHDPRQFTNPEVFDLHRNPNKHLAFSEGVHFCLGAPLARMESVAALRRLLRDDVNLELDLTAAKRQVDTPFYGYRSLPATLSA